MSSLQTCIQVPEEIILRAQGEPIKSVKTRFFSSKTIPCTDQRDCSSVKGVFSVCASPSNTDYIPVQYYFSELGSEYQSAVFDALKENTTFTLVDPSSTGDDKVCMPQISTQYFVLFDAHTQPAESDMVLFPVARKSDKEQVYMDV